MAKEPAAILNRRFFIILGIVALFGYTFGKDLALRDNARDEIQSLAVSE